MDIKTKYDIGQKLWVVKCMWGAQTTVVQAKINSIEVGKTGVTYCIPDIGRFSEDQLFRTKNAAECAMTVEKLRDLKKQRALAENGIAQAREEIKRKQTLISDHLDPLIKAAEERLAQNP